MGVYEKVHSDVSTLHREQQIIEFWKENDIFKKSVDKRANCPCYTFYDGPPTANGKPHIGHVLTRAIKDLFPRYRTMKGFKVLRKAGWDTHGLPVELEVERQLGISGKHQIENYGIEAFVERCKESVWKYKKDWEKMSERVGYWADMNDSYITYDNSYIESVWWALRCIWDKGLIYKGHKIMPYCPRCGTSLSSHEVAQGYKDVKENSIVVKFELSPNEYILVWTTTPWTLPANVALAVNAKHDYIKICVDGEFFILAKPLVESVVKKNYSIVEEFKGQQLEGRSYKPLFNCMGPSKTGKRNFIIADDYVTLTDGTGVVHIAPFGEDDARVIAKHNIDYVNLVDTQGCFVDDVQAYKGIFVKDADKLIIKDLDADGVLFDVVEFEHNYPFCWRCDTPLLYYPCDTWFIRMTAVKSQLISNNDKINWLPENIKKGRFGNFLENVVDWGLSRTRYWGTPLPIWQCSCGNQHCVGSIEELKNIGLDVLDGIELHRPYIDRVVVKCSKCNGNMHRVPEVIDCWFDAGSMPFAQWHYPFDGKSLFDANFPADFISEAIDQTRGWFYTLHAISTVVFEKLAYKNVIVLGHVQDKFGVKMSKHKGNIIDPWDVLNKQGADAVRWHFYSASSPYLPSRFYHDAVDNSQRKFLATLWNTYSFYVLYANIDDFNPLEHTLDIGSMNVLDKWILSKFHNVVAKTDKALEEYKTLEAARNMQDFVDQLSNWYVRRNRERFWLPGMPQDKINAYMTLYTVLVGFCKLAAPFVPFMAEQIYQNLVVNLNRNAADGVDSVHMCDYPVPDPGFVFNDIEEKMEIVRSIVFLGRNCRNSAKVKNRQPLSKMYITCKKNLEFLYQQIIMDELNVKGIEFRSNVDEIITYKFKPQLKTMGPKYGGLVGKIFNNINLMKVDEVMAIWNSGGTIQVLMDDTVAEVAREDVLIEVVKNANFAVASDACFTVVLDIELTDDLVEEGFVREIISKIQIMRKTANFDVADDIKIKICADDTIIGIVQKNNAEIKRQTLAAVIEMSNDKESFTAWNINGKEVGIFVERT